MIIAGTDVLIDFLVGAQPVADQIAGYIETEQLQTTAVTSFELLSGADRSKRGQAARRLIDALDVLPLDRDAARLAAEVRRKLDRAGQAIGMGDSLIAGIVIAHGLPLFARKRAHFERVENLQLVKVSAARS